MSWPPKKTAPSAKTQRAEESEQADYPASLDLTVSTALDAIHHAQQQLRRAGCFLVRGNLPACVDAIEASRKGIGAALDSLSAPIGSA